MVRAILYDLDGVLVDAREWHYISLNRALMCVAGKGAVISRVEHETIFDGLPTKKKLEILLRQDRIRETDRETIWNLKQELTVSTIEEKAFPDLGMISLHETTRQAGIISACVTNSIAHTATLMLQKTGQLSHMEFVISNEMVRMAKPFPEGYIRAMIRLGTMPDDVLIVEDSDKGRQAAESSGGEVLMVTGPYEVAGKVMSRLRDQLAQTKLKGASA
jgi:beta-phosphoglucomutase